MGVSGTKVKTHPSRRNKSDKESLHELPPKGRPKCHGEQSGWTFNPIGFVAPKTVLADGWL